MLMLVSLLLALSAAVAGEVFDVTLTVRGIKAGVAVEGTSYLIGDKPSARALYLRDIGITMLPMFVAGLLAVHYDHPIGYGVATWFAVLAVKHIQGGLAWRKLLSK